MIFIKITIINAIIIYFVLLLVEGSGGGTSGEAANSAPHLVQNLAVSLFSKPQFSHFIISNKIILILILTQFILYN